MEEAFEGGPLRGPFTPQEVSELPGPLGLPVPRCLVKNDRAVDDGSIYGQSSTVAPGWKLVLGGLDEVVGLAGAWVRAVVSDRKVLVRLPCGRELAGALARDLTLGEALDLVGRLTDLKGAYKQFAQFPGHAFASVVTAWDPEHECTVHFISRALLFGQSGAVYGFSRVSKFVTCVATQLASLGFSGFLR